MLRVKRLYKKEEGYRTVLFHAEAALSCVIPSLMPRVPVYILSDVQYTELFPDFQMKDDTPTEILGCYVHDFVPPTILHNFKPDDLPCVKCNSIFLCEERIEKIAGKNELGLLMSKVLIHEFGHAYMDLFEPIGFTYADPIYKQNEESWANVFTLSVIQSNLSKIGPYIKGGTDVFFSKVKDFISKQPVEYALGGFLWECGIQEYDYWAYNKDNKAIWDGWLSFAMAEFTPYIRSSSPIPDTVKSKMLIEWQQIKKKLIEH